MRLRTFMISNAMKKSDPDSGQGASGDPEAAKKALLAMQMVIGPGRTCAPEISSSNSMHLSWANQATRVPKRKALVVTCHVCRPQKYRNNLMLPAWPLGGMSWNLTW